MLKMTFDRESSIQCTNPTKLSASKPTQKIVFSKIFFKVDSTFTNADHNLVLGDIYPTKRIKLIIFLIAYC